MRPNASFVSTSITGFAGQVTNLYGLPTSGTNGDKYLVGSSAVCIGGFTICTGLVGNTYTAGVYTRSSAATNMTGYTETVFNPGIIALGTSLGAQMPPANHARLPWTSPPNIGAY